MNPQLTRRAFSAAALSPLLRGAETSSERGKRIVMESLKALGGDKFLAMKDRAETGRAYSFFRDKMTGMSIATFYTRYEDMPNKGELAMRERQVYGKKEEESVLFLPNGEGWQLTFRGARPYPKERLDRYRDTMIHNVFYIFRTRLKEPGLAFDSHGTEAWNNVPVEVVEISDSENRSTMVYFNHLTKLPIHQVFVRRDPKTKEKDQEESVFSKYRDVGGGVMWPFDIRRDRNGEKSFELFSDTVNINQGLNDKLFELPDGTKKLKPIA